MGWCGMSFCGDFFFFSSRRRHTRLQGDWSSDVCSSDLVPCGTTGEAATLTPAEQERVIALTVETARGRARVVAGVGSNATAATIERARAAPHTSEIGRAHV